MFTYSKQSGQNEQLCTESRSRMSELRNGTQKEHETGFVNYKCLRFGLNTIDKNIHIRVLPFERSDYWNKFISRRVRMFEKY